MRAAQITIEPGGSIIIENGSGGSGGVGGSGGSGPTRTEFEAVVQQLQSVVARLARRGGRAATVVPGTLKTNEKVSTNQFLAMGTV